jgi:starch-binding outer membrane protein, SusD/RagB family
MKRYNIFFLIMILLLFKFQGCKKMMHNEESSVIRITSYNQLLLAAGGVYASLSYYFKLPNSFYAANLKGDDLNVGFAQYNYNMLYKNNRALHKDCYNKQYNFSNNYFLWKGLYSTIVSVNNIISQFNLPLTKDQPTREILGEMYLIRAYCFFRLTRCYGQVPIITDIEINYNIPKPSYTELYTFIENDLKTAMQLLPENSSSARVPFVTPHRGSAKAILAEVYLSWAGYPAEDKSKYTLAAKEAGETIDSADYFGLGLVNDFAFLWDKQHLYNCESVFSLYSDNPSPESVPNKGAGWEGFYYGDKFSHNIILSNENKFFVDFFPVEINFYNNFPKGYRKEITFYTTVYYVTRYYDLQDSLIREDTGHFHINRVDSCSRIAYRKFYYEPYTTAYYIHLDGSTDSIEKGYYFGTPRVYIFRFAQTILTYAEASARSGLLNAKAYECVNMIKRRAHHVNIGLPSVFDMSEGLLPEVFADSVVWERAWELCGEPEGRWFDLVRLEMVEELPKLRHPNEGDPPNVYDKSIYFFPIPANDTILNPNLGNY